MSERTFDDYRDHTFPMIKRVYVGYERPADGRRFARAYDVPAVTVLDFCRRAARKPTCTGIHLVNLCGGGWTWTR